MEWSNLPAPKAPLVDQKQDSHLLSGYVFPSHPMRLLYHGYQEAFGPAIVFNILTNEYTNPSHNCEELD